MCAQRGVEMENVREKEKEGRRGRRGREETQRTKGESGGRSARERRKRGIEGERRNTWFYLQKQSLRGTNTGRH